MNWDNYFLDMVEVVRSKSQDESFKVGAVIADEKHRTLSTGYNGLPRGISYRAEFHQRPDKYMWFVHAEENAIFNAAAVGTKLEGSTLYTVRHPCVNCCRAIIQSGIEYVIYREDFTQEEIEKVLTFDPDNWRGKMEAAVDMLLQAGVGARKAR